MCTANSDACFASTYLEVRLSSATPLSQGPPRINRPSRSWLAGKSMIFIFTRWLSRNSAPKFNSCSFLVWATTAAAVSSQEARQLPGPPQGQAGLPLLRSKRNLRRVGTVYNEEGNFCHADRIREDCSLGREGIERKARSDHKRAPASTPCRIAVQSFRK